MDDIVIDCGLQSVMLRKERQGAGNGRVYTVKLEVTDDCGNTGYALFQASVPHSRNSTAVDDGAASGYTVTTCTPAPKSIARDGLTPEGVTLSQNYPNPFNPSTTIRFTVPEATVVSITVFDVNGRKVATVLEGAVSAGSHSVLFDAADLPSGMYIYRLEANDVTLTRMLQLAK